MCEGGYKDLDKVFGVQDIMYKIEEIKKILISKNLQIKFLNLLDVNRKGGVVDIDASDAGQKMVFVVGC